MASIDSALQRVKDEYQQLLSPDIILHVCVSLGHTWRNRLLGPVATVHLFVLQVLHGNLAVNALRRRSPAAFSDTAYVQARQRLPLALLRTLLGWVNAQAAPMRLRARGDDDQRFHGHRLWTLDGTGVSMPDTPELQRHFGQPGGQKPGCGFPVAHLLCLFDYATGMVLDMIVAPLRTHDLRHAWLTHRRLEEGDVLLGDRAFGTFAHIALLLRENLHGFFRLHQRVQVPAKPRRRGRRPGRPVPTTLRRLKTFPVSGPIRDDFLARWPKPPSCPAWMSRGDRDALPLFITVRIVRYRVARRGFRTRQATLVTTLTDPVKYPARELAGLYWQRWTVEVNLRHLKTTMHMDVLRTRSAAGVRKELLVYALVYNLVCLVRLEAARRQGVPADRVSFVDALRWLADASSGPPVAAPILPRLVVNPHRPGRVQPRAVKRRPKEYPPLSQPRHILIQLLLTSAHAA